MNYKYMNNPVFYDLFNQDTPGLKKKQDFFLSHSNGYNNILELGAGTGNITLHLAAHGKSVTCVEPSETVFNILLSKIISSTKFKNSVTAICCFAQDFHCSKKFDLIIAPNLMHLVPDEVERKKILYIIKEHLTESGKLIITFFSNKKFINKPSELTGEEIIGGRKYRQFTNYDKIHHEEFNLVNVKWTFEVTTDGELNETTIENFLCRCDEIGYVRSLLGEAGFSIEFCDYDQTVFVEDKDDEQVIVVAELAGAISNMIKYQNSSDGTNNTKFIKFTAIACLLSAITTIGIHSLFRFDTNTFEERIMLHQNSMYLLNRWWVIVHCLLVIVAMWGFLLVQFRKAAGFTGLGFMFFAVFGITEILRQLLVLFYLNGMRKAWLAADSEPVKIFLANNIDNFGLISASLFGLFILAFALGNLFYGLSLLKETGFSKIVGLLLLIWSAGNFLALGNEFWHSSALSKVQQTFNQWYQPFMRVLLAVWLWKAAGMKVVTKAESNSVK